LRVCSLHTGVSNAGTTLNMRPWREFAQADHFKTRMTQAKIGSHIAGLKLRANQRERVSLERSGVGTLCMV